MKSWRSIEFRLAAGYSMLLILGLASLGGLLWFGVNYSMVAAVDDLLATRIDRLVAFVDAEFSGPIDQWSEDRTGGEFKAIVESVDAERRTFSVQTTPIRFTSDTVFESDLQAFSAADIEAGQYVEVIVQRRDGQWVAEEVSLEASPSLELQLDLVEYARSVPDGRLLHVRTADDEVFVTPDEGAAVPWQERLDFTTFDAEGVPYRVLRKSIQLAGQDYQIQVATSLGAVAATRERLVSMLAWLLPGGLLLSLVGGYVISRAALRPVERIAELAARVDVAQLSERIEVPRSGDVVQRLAETFNGMLSRLQLSVTRLEQFTADASHELRSPVAVIRTGAELALRQAHSEDSLRQGMKEIHDEAIRLTELLEDLLTLTRADSGAVSLPTEPIDLAALAAEVSDAHRRFLNGRALTFELAEDRLVVRGHEVSLRRLLVILLDNAAQHTPEDGPIWVWMGREGEQVVLSVSDTGDGIPADKLEAIFERFYRVDSSRSRANGSFGLGLSIARWIVESHGGLIQASSIVGKGSTFTVRLQRA